MIRFEMFFLRDVRDLHQVDLYYVVYALMNLRHSDLHLVGLGDAI